MSLQPEDDPEGDVLREEHQKLIEENQRLEARVNALEAACAAKDAPLRCLEWNQKKLGTSRCTGCSALYGGVQSVHNDGCVIAIALADDAGKGWLDQFNVLADVLDHAVGHSQQDGYTKGRRAAYADSAQRLRELIGK